MKNKKLNLEKLETLLKTVEKSLQKNKEDAIIALINNKIIIETNRLLTKKEILDVYNMLNKEFKIFDFEIEKTTIENKNFTIKGKRTILIFLI